MISHLKWKWIQALTSDNQWQNIWQLLCNIKTGSGTYNREENNNNKPNKTFKRHLSETTAYQKPQPNAVTEIHHKGEAELQHNNKQQFASNNSLECLFPLN